VGALAHTAQWSSEKPMTKARLFRKRFGDPSAAFELQNVRVARLIVENAEPGDRGLAVQWAELVLQRNGSHVDPSKREGEPTTK
jgi:hypothetical protein